MRKTRRLVVEDIARYAEPKEMEFIERVLLGESIEQISKDLRVSKKTIYKFFEKVRKKTKIMETVFDFFRVFLLSLTNFERNTHEK